MLPPLKPDSRVTLLFLCWRDIKAPKRGGAEVYTHEVLKRADHSRFRIIHLSPVFEGAATDEVIDGIRYLRAGNVLSVIQEARQFYRANADKIDFVIDQCNTHRFFTKLWVPSPKRIFFIHQLTREIWHINMKAPTSYLGAWTETPFLRLSKNDETITVSQSTKQDLLDVGFAPNKVTILPEGIDFHHWKPEQFLAKVDEPTFIYVGRFARYKGIDDVVEAFGRLRKTTGTGKLHIVGKANEDYIRNSLKPIMEKYQLTWGKADEGQDVTFFGFVSEEEKLNLMSRAHALIFPSAREGWGLIVTEAAAVGTPSIVYNSPGIVDAVDFGNAGYLTAQNTPEAIEKCMYSVIEDATGYAQMRQQAYDYACQFHWDNTVQHFHAFLNKVIEKRNMAKSSSEVAHA